MTDGRHFRTSERDEYFIEEGCYILELLNDAADPDASVARARVPPGVTTRRHRLLATTERYLIVEGRGEARVGAAVYPVVPGDSVLIPPGAPQQISNTGPGDLVFLAICTPRFRPENYRDDAPSR